MGALTPAAWERATRPLVGDRSLWAVLVGDEPGLVANPDRPWWAFWRPSLVEGRRPWRSLPVSCPMRSERWGDGLRIVNTTVLDFGSIPVDRVTIWRVEVLDSAGTALIRLPFAGPRVAARAGDAWQIGRGGLEVMVD